MTGPGPWPRPEIGRERAQDQGPVPLGPGLGPGPGPGPGRVPVPEPVLVPVLRRSLMVATSPRAQFLAALKELVVRPPTKKVNAKEVLVKTSKAGASSQPPRGPSP